MRWTPEHLSFRDEFDIRTAQRLGAEHVQELLERRRAGSPNDTSSVGPGVTVILKDTSPSRSGFMEAWREGGLDGLRPAQDMLFCYVAELPEGGYVTAGSDTQVFTRVEQHGEPDRSTFLFGISFGGFIRLEGVNGELLQSPLYLPNGNPVQ